eukprot:CAMPEP_0203905728 /NCGR_PEP_ID=MMETSP0359-20131031/47431_1 /ASSEMBLY_ACC=CAM_ASM_000338 /TAXON_ID=268821 /ORGANISM="Scrippsiella Hangoei, Strain SHTV-5" /LENGTH=285 /DNA_ID=CAMNT_0050830251 /DNA_START=37 /DNA_END=891 /DNA_ORIENTATION=-
MNVPKLQLPLGEPTTLAYPSPAYSLASSLALSAQSSPLSTLRTGRAGSHDDVYGYDAKTNRESCVSFDASTVPSSSMVTAKFDVSDFFVPMEERLHARISALEAVVEQRCGALEQRVAAEDKSSACDARSLQQQVQDLQAQLANSSEQQQQPALAALDRSVRRLEGQCAAIESGLGDLWRELQSDRQAKCQSLPASFDMNLRALQAKVERLLAAPPAPCQAAWAVDVDEEGGDLCEAVPSASIGSILSRARSSPLIAPAAGQRSMPTLLSGPSAVQASQKSLGAQ